jgi:hypothetical protein
MFTWGVLSIFASIIDPIRRSFTVIVPSRTKIIIRNHPYTVKPVMRGHLYTVKPVMRGHLEDIQ